MLQPGYAPFARELENERIKELFRKKFYALSPKKCVRTFRVLFALRVPQPVGVGYYKRRWLLRSF